jgi:uncharacterized protein YjbI with pentapeptide repeats
MAEDAKADGEVPKPPKIKAEDNPWYLLATLYGEPQEPDYDVVDRILRGAKKDELREKNRIAWNRYFAANLDNETRARLIEEKRHPVEELTPLSAEELAVVEEAFAKRAGSSVTPVLPPLNFVINFSDVQFDNRVDFAEHLFAWATFFFGATFSGNHNSFYGVTFCGGAFFDRTIFTESASFNEATFSGGASFDEATFYGSASFDGATFSKQTQFVEATFLNPVTFSGAIFCGNAVFYGATFSSSVLFDGAIFSGSARFIRAKFQTLPSFVNAEMKTETSFEDAIFDGTPPRFFGAKLHEGTVWRDIKPWPTPKKMGEAGPFVDAYERLKLEMDRLRKHEDELDFFALELQSRRVLLGTWKGLPIAVYGVLSDYGRSYLRPLIALFYLALIGTLAFLSSDSLSPWQSLGLSAANTLNVFGFRKDFINPSVIAHLPAWLEVVAAVQTILGTILLFLFGLGIRNRFRMK